MAADAGLAMREDLGTICGQEMLVFGLRSDPRFPNTAFPSPARCECLRSGDRWASGSAPTPEGSAWRLAPIGG